MSVIIQNKIYINYIKNPPRWVFLIDKIILCMYIHIANKKNMMICFLGFDQGCWPLMNNLQPGIAGLIKIGGYHG